MNLFKILRFLQDLEFMAYIIDVISGSGIQMGVKVSAILPVQCFNTI